MDARSGWALDGDAHLAQSVADILMTPVGSRVMRRDYGSHLPELIDQPMNGATRVRLYGAVAMALMRWEPRLRLTRVQLSASDNGAIALELEAERSDRGRRDALTAFTVPLRPAAA